MGVEPSQLYTHLLPLQAGLSLLLELSFFSSNGATYLKVIADRQIGRGLLSASSVEGVSSGLTELQSDDDVPAYRVCQWVEAEGEGSGPVYYGHNINEAHSPYRKYGSDDMDQSLIRQ